ncbi:MAG: orotidine-5'-phosphate decarboxylase [Clostridia bacterium]|nr:orotidine-5'-phosphate decarboxylase [Clostridia bacterium]
MKNENSTVDRLIERILAMKNPSVVGIDPDYSKIPACYHGIGGSDGDTLAAVAAEIEFFGKDIIDAVCDIVPAIKPQMAFYEKYGWAGVRAFERTVAYAKERGLVVIEDAKRGDIGNTAYAYAQGHLSDVEVSGGMRVRGYDVDFLTVSPYLGSESLAPMVDAAVTHGKGIFILVKTSNRSAGEVQDARTARGETVSEMIADYVANEAERAVGAYGYSGIGAVVGATYPQEMRTFRQRMPRSFFLVPGYGAQGGAAADAVGCFCADGLGAVVNSSRGLLYSHMSEQERAACTREEYRARVRAATIHMRDALLDALRKEYGKTLLYG